MITFAVISLAMNSHASPVHKRVVKPIEPSSVHLTMEPARAKFNFPYIHTNHKLEAMQETICELQFRAN
jgi:hypothetical protein